MSDGSNMVSHVRSHVPLMPFKCEFCGYRAKRIQNLNAHMERGHAGMSGAVRDPELRAEEEDIDAEIPSSVKSPMGSHDWKHVMSPGSAIQVRNSIVLFGSKMRDPKYNFTDSEGIKIVLKTLKRSYVPGAKELYRHLRKLRSDGSLTWKRLIEEFD